MCINLWEHLCVIFLIVLTEVGVPSLNVGCPSKGGPDISSSEQRVLLLDELTDPDAIYPSCTLHRHRDPDSWAFQHGMLINGSPGVLQELLTRLGC